MLRKLVLAVALVLAWPIFGQEIVNDCNSCVVVAQTGTPHGVMVKFTAVSQGSDPNTIAGYNIYQCQGTCTASAGVWTKIDTSLDVSTSYLVPLSGLTASGTYSFVVTAVDSGGNESAFSNVATVTLPAVLPVDPNAPANVTATVQ